MTPFFKKYKWWLVGGAAAVLLIAAAGSGNGTPSQAPAQSAAVVESQSAQQVSNAPSTPQIQNQTVQTSQSQPTLSNDNYYTNSSGNTVHSPAYSSNGSVPAGATARCRNGTYSFSQHRSGTCSYNGGVAEWLN